MISRQSVYVLLVACLLAVLGCSKEPAPSNRQPIYGAKIYTFEGDASSLFEEWNRLGLNTAWIGKELFSDATFREAARSHGIETFVVLPTFFDPEALEADSTLAAITSHGDPAVDDWVRFVCPSQEDFRKRQVEEVVRVVRDWQPDGISIDFIRHFVFWETVFPDTPADSLPNTCFDDHCMMAFQDATGIRLPASVDGPEAAAIWIRENRLETWIDWKCSLITGMVEEIETAAHEVDPSIKIMLHIVPWKPGEYGDAIKRVAGQEIEALSGFADLLSPMTYHHMVKRPPSWIHEVVVSLSRQSETTVLPSIQVSKAYLDEPLSSEAFHDAITSALAPPSGGVVFWEWAHLAASPEKRDLVAELLSTQ